MQMQKFCNIKFKTFQRFDKILAKFKHFQGNGNEAIFSMISKNVGTLG